MVNNQQSLAELAWAIEMAQGQFTPILAHCNYSQLREKMVQELREICPVKIPEITLEPGTTQLYSVIRKFQAEAEGEIPGIQIVGLDSVKDIDRLLQEINPVREEFRKNCPFAVVLWVSDRIIQRLIRVISDFESWTTRIEFSLSDEELLEEIRQKTETLFTAVLQIGDAEFVPNQVILGSPYLLELEFAVRDLSRNLSGDRHQLPPELVASLKFVQGRDAYIQDEIDPAIKYYQESLDFWQQSNQKERQGIIFFHLGLCSQRQAELNRQAKQKYLKKALSYYQQAIDIFEQAKRPDLVAKFIGQTGDMLRRLKDWDNLAKLAKKSQQLHTRYGSPVQLARDYGFLAEVALNQRKFAGAKKLAEQAIYILTHPENIQKTSELCRGKIFAKTLYCSPLMGEITPGGDSAANKHNYTSHLTTPYLLLLARSFRGMGQVKKAVKTLNIAKKTNPEYYPQLYLEILEELRIIYFEHKKYLKAFQLKLEQRSLQQQFRLTAFIGAGRLQSQRYPKMVQMMAENRENVAEEIIASGREKDLQQLWQKLSSTYSKLIVIHGQSGVGKSSLVNAGLIPSLKQKSIGTKDCLPVTLRVYTNWQAELGKQLANALAERGVILPEIPNTPEQITSYLRKKQPENLLTVLIFDQFEEFFFVCQKTAQQQEFFQFLADGLHLPGVKVILSLRTDYLHYLLIANCLPSFDIINNDILGKNVLYAIGNFSAADAAEIITRLTKRSQFQLEPELITEMVKDLAYARDELYPSVRPIELQVVGAQMQAENITTLAEYRAKGPKEKLVQRYLDSVVQDCGEENKQMAELVLYFLTDQNNHRPLKTLTELIAELKVIFTDLNGEGSGSKADIDQLVRQLKLVLDIFVKSGLVFEVSDIPISRYQLVHDYLVDLIHQQKIDSEVGKLQEERQKRKQAEAKFNQILLFFLGFAAVAVLALGFLVVREWKQARDLEQQKEQLQKQKEYLKEIMADKIKTDALLAKNLVKDLPEEALYRAIAVKAESEKTFSQYPQIQKSVADILSELMPVAYEFKPIQDQTNILSVAMTSDGLKILSSGWDGIIRIYDFQDNQVSLSTRNNSYVNSLAITPDAQKIVFSSEGNKIQVWRIGDPELVQSIKTGSSLPKRGITSSDRKIYSSGLKRKITEWNFDENKPQGSWGRGSTIRLVAITPDGSKIVSGSRDGMIRVWDIEGKKLAEFPTDQTGVTSVAITPDGSKIVSSSSGNTIKVWDSNGKELAKPIKSDSLVSSVAITPDGSKIISGHEEGKILVWDIVSGKELMVLRTGENTINSLAITPDGKKIIAGGADGVIRLWPISWDAWLEAGCERLRLHPVFVETEVPANKKAIDPVNICQQKWSAEQKAEFYIQQGLEIARRTGDVEKAELKFKQAQNSAPNFYASLKNKPEEQAKSEAALFLVQTGKNLIEARNIPEAIAKFEQAQHLYPGLSLDWEVQDLVRNFLVDQGYRLAEEGKVSEAIAKFKQIESLNIPLEFDPEERVKQIAVPILIVQGANLMRENHPSEGFAKYQEALALDPELTMTEGWDLNQLCWYGSLQGYAAEMMLVCDRAVESVYYGFDSRGVARAMTGDYGGAIEDFQAFIDILNDWIQYSEGGEVSQSVIIRKAQREAWIDALAKGQNPFTKELVQELVKQPPFTFSFGR